MTSEAGRTPRQLRIPTRRVAHPNTASPASRHGGSPAIRHEPSSPRARPPSSTRWSRAAPCPRGVRPGPPRRGPARPGPQARGRLRRRSGRSSPPPRSGPTGPRCSPPPWLAYRRPPRLTTGGSSARALHGRGGVGGRRGRRAGRARGVATAHGRGRSRAPATSARGPAGRPARRRPAGRTRAAPEPPLTSCLVTLLMPDRRAPIPSGGDFDTPPDLGAGARAPVSGCPRRSTGEDAVLCLSKVLVANRGEIAVRVVRACRDAGLASVAVYAEPDRDAPFVTARRRGVRPRRQTSADSYLRIDKVLDAAQVRRRRDPPRLRLPVRERRVRAGRPRRGPDLDRPVARRRSATSATRSPPATSPRRPGRRWPPAPSDPVANADEVVAFAKEYGVPVAIKAAFGGGGRGMKVAHTIEEIPELFESATREAIAAFGRGECFVEQYLDKPRHVEAQVIADQHGNVVVAGTRDCSLQRRFQKLVEEAPAPFLTDDSARASTASAKAICREAGYYGAGTVEYLVGQGGTSPSSRSTPACRSSTRSPRRPRASTWCASSSHRQRRRARRHRGPHAARALLRVPHQRRGRRARLPARPRHGHHLRPADRARRARGLGRRDRLGDRRPVRLHARQAHRHRRHRAQALERARRALAEFAGRGPGDGDPVPPGHRARPGVHRRRQTFDVHTKWIETEWDNTVEPFTGDRAERRGRAAPADRRRRGRRPPRRGVAARAVHRSAAAAVRGGGPAARSRSAQARRRRAAARPVTPSPRRCRAPSSRSRSRRATGRGGRPDRGARGHEDGEPGQRPQGRHRHRSGRRDRRRHHPGHRLWRDQGLTSRVVKRVRSHRCPAQSANYRRLSVQAFHSDTTPRCSKCGVESGDVTRVRPSTGPGPSAAPALRIRPTRRPRHAADTPLHPGRVDPSCPPNTHS